MALEEMKSNYHSSNLHIQPTFALQTLFPDIGMYSSFHTLLAAIDLGWKIAEPVQVLPSFRNDIWTYYFVITPPVLKQSYRLFVPAGPEVEHFVEQGEYQVIEGSYY
jgi:hypothetical protein